MVEAESDKRERKKGRKEGRKEGKEKEKEKEKKIIIGTIPRQSKRDKRQPVTRGFRAVVYTNFWG